MKKSVMLRDELIKRTGISEPVMGQIEAMKVIRPLGLTDDKVPFYSEEAVEQINYIKNMTGLGYSMEEIQRVVRKVGFPKNIHVPESKAPAVKHLTVGDLAEKVGVSPRTIKHWEEKGIIEADMRSGGGFRLYSEVYVYLCNLIRDLQLFGYSLEQIKEISELFREFLVLNKNVEIYPRRVSDKKLDTMLAEITALKERMKLLKSGIARWEDLVNKKVKEITALKKKNEKRSGYQKAEARSQKAEEKQKSNKKKGKAGKKSEDRSRKKDKIRSTKSETRNKSK